MDPGKGVEKLKAQIRREKAAARKVELQVRQIEERLIPLAKVEQEVLCRIIAYQYLFASSLPQAAARMVKAIRASRDQSEAASRLLELLEGHFMDFLAGLADAPELEIKLTKEGAYVRPKQSLSHGQTGCRSGDKAPV